MRLLIQLFAFSAGLALLSSCSYFQKRGSIETPAGSVVGVADAGKPATLASEGSTATLTLPAGTKVTTVKETASAGIPATPSSPAIAPTPEREITTFSLPSVAEWKRVETKLSANTGTVDTSIAKARIDAQESRVLLYASIAAAVSAGFFIYRAYPTPAICCGAGSVVFFLAWKMSGLPEWFWVVGALGLAAAAFLYIGHERGLKSNGTTN